MRAKRSNWGNEGFKPDKSECNTTTQKISSQSLHKKSDSFSKINQTTSPNMVHLPKSESVYLEVRIENSKESSDQFYTPTDG